MPNLSVLFRLSERGNGMGWLADMRTGHGGGGNGDDFPALRRDLDDRRRKSGGVMLMQIVSGTYKLKAFLIDAGLYGNWRPHVGALLRA